MKSKPLTIVLGGSPCTFWSIAQTRHRESKPEGMGWELFQCYVDAVRKVNPDVFLYENNVSASRDVKDAIRSELGVWEGAIIGGEDTGVRYIEIDSALVSAQMRKRLYVVKGCGEPTQPKDRGIVIADILETGEAINCATGDKSYCLKGQYHKNGMANFLLGGGHYPGTGVAERTKGVPIALNSKSGTFGGRMCGKGGQPSAQNRVYSVEGKMPAVTASYLPSTAIPVLRVPVANKAGYVDIKPGDVVDLTNEGSKTRRGRHSPRDGKAHTITGNVQSYEYCGTSDNPAYDVKDGAIEIKGKRYPIKLKDGRYIIRKLSVRECERLQTMPEGYTRVLKKSSAYKALGNGWTAEVIVHLLSGGVLRDIPRDTELRVVSMFDGIATGRYVLDRMGFTNVRYYAYEIDRNAIKCALSNYPDIIEMGDAFQVREDGWRPPWEE